MFFFFLGCRVLETHCIVYLSSKKLGVYFFLRNDQEFHYGYFTLFFSQFLLKTLSPQDFTREPGLDIVLGWGQR